MRTRTPATALAAAVLAVATALTGCGASSQTAAAPAAEQVKELRYQGGANGVTLAELAEDLGYLGDVELKWVGNTTSGPQDIQSAASGATEFGGAFDGAVAKLVASGAPVQAVITYYGSDEKAYNGFFVLDGSPIREARDLSRRIAAVQPGKTVEVTLYRDGRERTVSLEVGRQSGA